MSRLLVNRDGGTSNEYGTFAALGRLFTGDVIEGFQVVPNGTPNMTVKVNPGSGRITTGTYPSSYGYFVSHDTTGGESVTIATAAASPRIDYIVAYVDKSVTPSASPGNVNNTNNIFKFASVAGTPSGSPVVPTVGQIQTAIGAANPYIILAQIAVGASVSTIATPNITDLRVPVSTTQSSKSIKPANVDSSTSLIWSGWSSGNFGTTQTSLGTFAVVIPAGCNAIEIAGAVRIQSQDSTQKDSTIFLSNNQNGIVTHSVIFTALSSQVYASATNALVDRIAVTSGTTVIFDMRAVTSAGASNSGSGKIIFRPVAI